MPHSPLALRTTDRGQGSVLQSQDSPDSVQIHQRNEANNEDENMSQIHQATDISISPICSMCVIKAIVLGCVISAIEIHSIGVNWIARPHPADTRRNNNVILTSKRRCFDVIMTLLLRLVSVG